MSANQLALMNLDADSWRVNHDRNVNSDDQRFRDDNKSNETDTTLQRMNEDRGNQKDDREGEDDD